MLLAEVSYHLGLQKNIGILGFNLITWREGGAWFILLNSRWIYYLQKSVGVVPIAPRLYAGTA